MSSSNFITSPFPQSPKPTYPFNRMNSAQQSLNFSHSKTYRQISDQIQQLEHKYQHQIKYLTEQLKGKNQEIQELRKNNTELEKQNYYLNRRLREGRKGEKGGEKQGEEEVEMEQGKDTKGREQTVKRCGQGRWQDSQESEKENRDGQNRIKMNRQK